MNIIVIDDDRLVAVSLKTILESTGSITVAAIGNSGAEAEIPVARHEDLNAASQTVRVPERPPAVPAVMTGDGAGPAVLIAVCVGAGAAGAVSFKVIRKKKIDL